jgi:hypothetical protein
MDYEAVRNQYHDALRNKGPANVEIGERSYILDEKDGESRDEISRARLFVPSALRTGTLVAFFLLFLLMLSGLLALMVVSHKHQGFSDGVADRYTLLWTYGPTAGTFAQCYVLVTTVEKGNK